VIKPLTLLLSAALSHSVIADTSMTEVLDEHGIVGCKPQLEALADSVIGENEHRLHLYQPKRHADKYPFSVTGIISYRDQEAQIEFNASPMIEGGCEVSYVESFALPETCVKIREEVFKKWKFVGRLSDKSFFLHHKKELARNATLTSINSGSACLITRRDSGI
jgi:hypothetical protein